MPVVKDPTLWDYLPQSMKVKLASPGFKNFTGGHPLVPKLAPDEDKMITILLDTVFYQRYDDFLYLMDAIEELEQIILSIKFVERKPLLYKLIQLGSRCAEYTNFHILIEYLKLELIIIDPSKIKSKSTLGNILRANSKIVQTFLNHSFEYRPPEEVEKGREEIFSSIPGAQTIDNLNSTFDSIQETSRNVEKSLNETTRVLRELAPKVSEAMTSASEMKDCVPHLVDTLKAITQFTNAGKETLGKLGRQVEILDDVNSFASRLKKNWPAVIACVTGISISKSMTDLLTHVVPLLTILGLDTNVTNYFSEFFTKKAQTQDGFTNTKKLMLFLASFLGKYSPLSFCSKFTSNLNSVTKEMESLDKLFDMMGDVLSEFGLDITSKARAISELREDMKALIDATPEFESLLATKGVVFVREAKYKEFMKQYNRIQNIKKQVDCGCYSSIRNSNFCADLMNFNTRYVRMKQAIDQIRATNGRRQEPVAVLFHGAPKLGKSQLMCYLQRKIWETYSAKYASDPAYDFMDDFNEWTTWDQNTTDDYHQGYNGQEIHRIDDLFSRVDEMDHRDILNFVSCVVFPTRQAELSEKGKPYTAKLIIASANEWPNSSKQIKCVDALHRRFTVVKFVLKPGKKTPSKGFDKTFDWLNLYEFEGSSYKAGSQQKASTTLDDVCISVIENMRIKHDIFQAGLAAQQADNALTQPSVAFRKLPKTATHIMMTPDWNASARYHRSNKQIYRFLKLLKTIDPVSKKEHYITELQLLNCNFKDTMFVLFCLDQTSRPAADFTIILKDVDGSYVYFDMRDKKLYRTNEDLSAQEIIDDGMEQQTSFDDYCFTDQVYLYFIKIYEKTYRSFGPIIKILSTAGKLASYAYNPTLSLVMSMISVVVTFLSGCDATHILYRAWEMIYDFTNIMYLIPAVAAIGTLVYYKCRTFTMLEPCKNCIFYLENIEELKAAHCNQVCNYSYTGGHFEHCSKFNLYVSYALKDLCFACKNDACTGDCSHSLPEDEVDPYILKYFRSWIARNVQLDVPECIKEETPYHSEKIGMSYVEEVSPKDEKQAIFKRTMRQEGMTYQKPRKSRNQTEASPDKNNQMKIKRNILEESPDDNKLAKQKRRFRLEESDNWRSKIFEPTVVKRNNFEKELNSVDSGSEEYDHGGHTPGAKMVKKLNIKLISSGVENQALDQSSRDLFSALTKSSYRCCRVNSSGKHSHLYGHPFENYVITPAHLHMSSDPTAKYFMEVPINGEIMSIPMTLEGKRDSRDVARWKLETKLKFPRRFYDNLITEDEFLKIANQEIYVLQHLPKLNVAQLVTSTTVEHKKLDLQGKGIKTYEKLLVVQATMMHSPVTTEGDCGGILVAFNTHIKKKIIGFHVVGALDKAYSAILTKELVDSLALEVAREEELRYEIIDQNTSEFPIVDILGQVESVTEKPVNLPYGDFEYLGELSYMARPAANTGIKKHPLFGTFEVTSAPANLSSSEVVDKSQLRTDILGNPNLLITRTEKYGKVFKNKVDLDILTSMENQLTDYYIKAFEGKDLGVSTDYEILNGNPDDPDSHHLDMRTSSGIYWSGTQDGHAYKKDHYVVAKTDDKGQIYKEFDYEKPHVQELMKVIEATEDLAEKGYRTLSINKDCFKDEVRPLDKVHKPRIFKNVPFDKVILLKKYGGKFKTEWTKMRGEMFHSVGINTTSPEWATLYHEMCEKSHEGCDADFGTFDGNLRPEFMDVAYRVIRKTIASRNGNDPRVDKILAVLFDEIVRSISVSCYTVYMDRHGNPSGSPFTTITNCIVNMLYHWYCFIRITGYMGLDRFIETVCLRCFGDDVIYTASRSLGFTFENIQKIMIDELEQDYTDASKSAEGAIKPIKELSYLKRKFRVISPSIILAPIETKSIEMRFNYTNIPMTDYLTHKELIFEGCLEACMHGPEYFKEFSDKISRGIRRSNLRQTMRGFNPIYSDYYQDLLKRYQ